MAPERADYDLFVVGTGEAGATAASICREKGWRVAIADENPFGGTCSLRGCNPKKILTAAAGTIRRAEALRRRGISGDARLDWSSLIDFKNRMTEMIPGFHEKNFKEQGLDTFHGRCRFVGPNEVSVNGKTISAKRFLLATGSRPRPLGISGEKYVTTSNELLNMPKVPEHVLFIGGGYISMEFAHVLAEAGCRVRVLEFLPTVLNGFDPGLVSMLQSSFRERQILVHTSTKVTAIERSDQGYVVHACEPSDCEFTADLVIHGAGRIPNVESLDLDAGNIAAQGWKIELNEYLQSTTNPAVYVAGDARVGIPQLTPVAEIDSRAVAENLLNGNISTPQYNAVPSAALTYPELARVGLLEDQVKEQGIPYQSHFVDTSEKHITRRLGLTHSAFHVLEDTGSGRILGAHMLGHNVEEVINTFAAAIATGSTIRDLKKIPWVFPTVTYDTFMRL